MKKQLLSILTAGCLMAAMVPAAFAADANDLQAQIDAAEAGSTIKAEREHHDYHAAEHQQEHYPGWKWLYSDLYGNRIRHSTEYK